ncbi:MAG: hypothetical protein SFT90_05550 [Rickettsiales bacterium]|nr:hypothetical protein [Rickettsiales bacterium]
MSLRRKHLKFIEDIKLQTDLSYTGIAMKAGLSDTTLTRFLNHGEYKRLSTSTLDKIAKVANYNSYEDYLFKNKLELDKDAKKIEFSESEIYEIFGLTKSLIKKKDLNLSPKALAVIVEKVTQTAKKLNTKFITESLITYVLEQTSEKAKKQKN